MTEGRTVGPPSPPLHSSLALTSVKMEGQEGEQGQREEEVLVGGIQERQKGELDVGEEREGKRGLGEELEGKEGGQKSGGIWEFTSLPIVGSVLVAGRDIQPWERVLTDTALVLAPTDKR